MKISKRGMTITFDSEDERGMFVDALDIAAGAVLDAAAKEEGNKRAEGLLEAGKLKAMSILITASKQGDIEE